VKVVREFMWVKQVYCTPFPTVEISIYDVCISYMHSSQLG